MKKLLLGALALFLMASCSGNGSSEKEREDSIPKVDSLAQMEATRQTEETAQAAAELARIDSLRQDSINQEIKMRLKPTLFNDFFNEKRMKKNLRAIGFKLVDEEFEKYEEFDSYWAKYKRTLNGRTIEVEFGYDTSNGGSIKFSDKNDFAQFKTDLLNSGFKKDEFGQYNHRNLNSSYPTFEIEGKNTVTFGYY